jgi:DNA-binding transcriptional LysR family regulator
MIELRHLRYFVAVAEELHFSRAAARLNMSQPPLSQQIKALEASVGTPLFTRNKRSVTLTSAGRDLYEQVGPWLAGLDAIAERTRRVGEGEVGSLRIGSNFTTTQRLLPELVRAFSQRFPAVSLRLQEASTAQQVELLSRGLLDVGFVRLPVDTTQLEATPLYEESLVVAMAKNHRHARRARLQLRELRDEVFLNASRQPVGLFQSVQSLCRQAGFEPRLLDISTNANTAVALAGAGLGIALVPESMKRTLPEPVVYKPLVDSPRSTVAVVRQRSGATPTALLFVEMAGRMAAG